MRTRYPVLVLLAIALITRDVRGQSAQAHVLAGPRQYDGPPLTLTAAIEEARARNPDLAALARQTAVVGERPAQERFLAPPMVETQIWQWPINTLNPANTSMFMFMATQDLPGRGKRDLRAAVAEKDVELAQSDAVAHARDVVRNVKKAYAMLFIARKAIDVHLANADVLREIADVAQVKYATGRMPQQDVLKAVVELSKLHDDIIALEQQAQIAGARLNTLMNRPLDAPIGPVTDPHEQILIPPAGQLESLAVAHQPQLRIVRQQTERAEAELAVVRQDYKPDYSVQAGYMLMPHQTDAFMARFGITWPNAPWARGKLDARVREMTAGVDASNARARALENATRLSVREAYINVKAAEQRAALLRTTIIPQAEQTLEVSRAAYQSDRIDFLPLLDNERSLLDAQLGYYRALAEFDQALASLERAVGADLTADMLSSAARPNGGAR
jgi:outer membrane protein TolC